MKKRWVDAAAMMVVWVAALVVIVQACEKAHAMVLPVNVRSVELWQSADSAYFAVVWSNRALSRGQLPIATYKTRLINASTGDTLATSSISAPAASDTIALPWGDSVLIKGAVLPIDVEGNEAVYPDGTVGWATSAAFLFYPGVVPPSPVDSVFILPIDTLPQIIGWHVRPNFMTIEKNTSAQYCLMVEFANGVKAFSNWGLSDTERLYCNDVYDRWLTEVAG